LSSLIFGEVLRLGFGAALGLFAGVELILALGSIWLFRSEMPNESKARP
jgi:hypothetical protein